MEREFDKYRVLIIDDLPEARAMLKNMLMDIGVTQVFEASDGKEGMKFIDAAFDFVDLVLCDWNMPAMDGISLLRQVRSADPAIPFMLITGRGDIDSVAQAKGAGVSGYILKPFSMTQLEAKMRVVIARSEKQRVAMGM